MSWVSDPNVWASFVTLSALEIVLGIDNLVFIAMISERLPRARRRSARRIGLALALATRLALLGSLFWLTHLTRPLFSAAGHAVSWRDLIMIGGGAFLLYKGTRELHLRVAADEPGAAGPPAGSFAGTIAQIVMLDIVFSLDSVITAIGIAQQIWVMAAAIVVAVALMLAASDPLASFISRHPSMKVLALAFLLLIGTVLVADGFGFHVPRGYIYAAMGFSATVEALNLLSVRRPGRRSGGGTRETAMVDAQPPP